MFSLCFSNLSNFPVIACLLMKRLSFFCNFIFENVRLAEHNFGTTGPKTCIVNTIKINVESNINFLLRQT